MEECQPDAGLRTGLRWELLLPAIKSLSGAATDRGGHEGNGDSGSGPSLIHRQEVKQ